MPNLVPPARRDIQGMTRLLADLTPGKPASVLLRDDLYGLFRVEGPVVRLPSVDNLAIGGCLIESGRKPERRVLALSTDEATSLDDEAGVAVAPSDIRHGSLVTATFEQAPYSAFSVTGRAIETAAGSMSLVGGWIIQHQGTVNARLRSLVQVADQSVVPAPRPITAWRDAESD
ncbi:hypothetical protein FQZ97_1027290 [compost metagenome]